MAKEILYLDGVTGLGEHEGDAWSYGPRYEVPMGDGDGIRNHVFKNEGRFFSDALGGDYNVWYGETAYIVPKDNGAGHYPWMQAGGWMKIGNPSTYLTYLPYEFERKYSDGNEWYAVSGSWYITLSGEIKFYGQASGVYHPIIAGKWFWFECRMYSHFTNGIAEMRVGDVSKRWTGIQTVYTGGAVGRPTSGEVPLNMSEFKYRDFFSTTEDIKYDDMYVMFADTEGELDWVGEGICEPLYVTGDGAEIMATPIGPTSHASVEFPVNDILYVAAIAGERDCYSFSNLESDRTRTVHGVKVTARAKRSYPGTATIRCYCRVNGSNYYGDTHYLSPEWREYIHIWAQNPDTSTAWTREDLDAAQFGFERVA